ncbi:MAG: endonuclease/exonuclease/phosphatase family protein [Phycisphaerales bacterium JB059]
MHLALTMLTYAAHALAAVLVVGTLIPFLPLGAWLVRGWDFPRVHIAVGCALLIALLVTLGAVRGWGLDLTLAIALLTLAGAWQIRRIAPYTPLWPVSVPATGEPEWRLLVVNLDKRNTRHDHVARMIRRENPDTLVLIEFGPDWADALSSERPHYAHHVEDIREDGLGLALWSRAQLLDPQIRQLVSDNRPSIHTALRLPDGRSIRLVALHPTPPGLPRDNDAGDEKGRYDSRIRDAELLLIADEIARNTDESWVVAGDFNDVAWSHTTRLFQRVSGLNDPRIGRGLFNTYNAKRPLLRYPVDHVFVSPGFAIANMRRVEIPGSDHFAILADLALQRDEPRTPDADAGDRQEAAEMIEEGREDAAETGESSDG